MTKVPSSPFAGKIFSITQLVDTGFASRRQIYRFLEDGEITAFRVGKSLKIRGEAVDGYIERHSRTEPRTELCNHPKVVNQQTAA